MSLVSLRRKIDRIDDEIIGLLVERMALALETAEFKPDVRDTARERTVISRLQARAAASNRISPEFVAALYELIFAESRKAQQALPSKEV